MPFMIFFPLLLLLSSSDARPTRSPLSKRGNGSADAPPGTYANGTKVAFQPDPDFVARSPTTWKVRVGGSSEGHVFTPPTVNAKVGDLISFSFASKAHAVIQSSLDSPCVPLDGGFQSPVYSVDPSQDDLPREDRPRFLLPVNTTDPIYFFGSDHCADAGMVGIINPPSDSTFQQFQDAAKASSSSSPSAGNNVVGQLEVVNQTTDEKNSTSETDSGSNWVTNSWASSSTSAASPTSSSSTSSVSKPAPSASGWVTNSGSGSSSSSGQSQQQAPPAQQQQQVPASPPAAWTKNFAYGQSFAPATDPNTGAEVPAWAQAYGYLNSNTKPIQDPNTGEPIGAWSENFGYPSKWGATKRMGKRQVENEGEEFDTDPGVGCDLSQVWFSNPAASKVQPPVGSTLRYVSSGRGLQNYTCTNGTYKTYGPFTQMYDVSCVITKRPSLLPLLQNILASFPRDDPASATDAIAQVYGKDEAKLGETILTDPKYHLGDFFFQFFDGTVSPLFDFRKVKGDDQFFYGKVKASEPDIIDGKNNIPWLNIGRANSTDPSLTGGLCDVILRDYTAGGVQPKECSADQEGDFLAVEYSAHYWYYGSGN